MKIITIDCYSVFSSFDKSESLVGHFVHESDAKQVADSSHFYEYRKFSKTFVLCESVADFTEMKLKAEIAKAKSKLSDRELEILGLTRD